MSAAYIENELPWSRWLPYLVTALDLEELSNYRDWWMAGQDPKKFTWLSDDKAGTTSSSVNHLERKIMKFAAEKLKAAPIKGDIWTLAKQKGMTPVYRVEDGGKVFYVDETGKEIAPSKGSGFIGSASLKEAHKNKGFYIRKSG